MSGKKTNMYEGDVYNAVSQLSPGQNVDHVRSLRCS